MDDDFLDELDRRISNVNSEKYWERHVGDYVLWLSPVDYVHQIRVKEALRDEKNANAIEETKRITLAGAIVGIGKAPATVAEAVQMMDLRPYRFSGKAFKVRTKGQQQAELLSLTDYLYRKIQSWDSEFIDVVFDVFADVMTVHRMELLANVQFLAKDPKEELDELEAKAAEIRQGLGLPPLIEARRLDGVAEEPLAQAESAGSPSPAESAGEEPFGEAPAAPAAEEDYDPFQVVSSKIAQEPVREAAPPEPPLPHSPLPPPPPNSFAVPVPPSPARGQTPIERELARRSGSAVPSGIPDGVKPFAAQPSVPAEVLESPAQRLNVPPPRLEHGPESQSRNPRFSRPT